VLAEFSRAMSPQETETTLDDIWSSLAEGNDIFAELAHPDRRHTGHRLVPERSSGGPFSQGPKRQSEELFEDQLELLLVDWTFGTEELSAYSSYVHQVEKEPCVFIHADDAAQAGLADGDQVTVQLDGGTLEVKLLVSHNMARGLLVLPRHRQLAWQKLREYPMTVGLGQVGKRLL